MPTYIVQRLAKSSKGPTPASARYEDVEEFDATDAEDALSMVIAKRQLWVGDDPWYPQDGGRRLPMSNGAGEQWYLFERS